MGQIGSQMLHGSWCITFHKRVDYDMKRSMNQVEWLDMSDCSCKLSPNDRQAMLRAPTQSDVYKFALEILYPHWNAQELPGASPPGPPPGLCTLRKCFLINGAPSHPLPTGTLEQSYATALKWYKTCFKQVYTSVASCCWRLAYCEGAWLCPYRNLGKGNPLKLFTLVLLFLFWTVSCISRVPFFLSLPELMAVT